MTRPRCSVILHDFRFLFLIVEAVKSGLGTSLPAVALFLPLLMVKVRNIGRLFGFAVWPYFDVGVVYGFIVRYSEPHDGLLFCA